MDALWVEKTSKKNLVNLVGMNCNETILRIYNEAFQRQKQEKEQVKM